MARGRRRTVAEPFEGLCDRCDQKITDFRRAVKRHGKWIHKACAPGADDV